MLRKQKNNLLDEIKRVERKIDRKVRKILKDIPSSHNEILNEISGLRQDISNFVDRGIRVEVLKTPLEKLERKL